jgi:hypothetical protein
VKNAIQTGNSAVSLIRANLIIDSCSLGLAQQVTTKSTTNTLLKSFGNVKRKMHAWIHGLLEAKNTKKGMVDSTSATFRQQPEKEKDDATDEEYTGQNDSDHIPDAPGQVRLHENDLVVGIRCGARLEPLDPQDVTPRHRDPVAFHFHSHPGKP